MSEHTKASIRRRDLAKLKKVAHRRGIPVVDLLANMISELEVKKLESDEEDTAICDNCDEEVPEDASFCPYCGVEFEEEEEEEAAEE